MKMRNVFYSICLSLVIAFVLLPTTRAEATEINFDDYGSTYAYNALASRDNASGRQKLYKDIYSLAKAFWTSTENLTDEMSNNEYVIGTIDISGYNLTQTDVIETFFSFKNDHPIFYYISNTVSINENGVVITADEDYRNASDREMYNSMVIASIDTYKSEVSSLSNKYEKVVAVHDKIVDNMLYEFDDEGNPSKEAYAHNILGAFVKGKGVCESYARTFQLAMNAINIDNVIITGVSNDENHAWNMVKLDDNKYYYVDCTWDDTTRSTNYLLKGRYVFDVSHKANTSQGTGIKYLYSLPAVCEDSYTKTFTLSCNGKKIGRFGSLELAFKKMTSTTGKYVVDIDRGISLYAPAGQWPKVAEIRFEGGEGFGDYFPLQLLGDSTANSNIVLNGISFDTQMTYILKNKKLAVLNLVGNSLKVEGHVKFGGYLLITDEDIQVGGVGVNIEGNKNSCVEFTSKKQENPRAVVEVRADFINVGKIIVNNTDTRFMNLDITANNLVYNGGGLRFYCYDAKPLNVNIKNTTVSKGCAVSIYIEPAQTGSNYAFGNIKGKGDFINFSITCTDKNKLPKISFTNSVVPIGIVFHNYVTGKVINDAGYQYSIHYTWNYNDFLKYKGTICNIGSTNMDKLVDIQMKVAKVNGNGEIEYLPYGDWIRGLYEKDSKGNLKRKYDENYDILGGVLQRYAFLKKCTIKNVIIPSNVKEIASYAFLYCPTITSVTIPSSVKTIGDGAFIGSPKLKTVTIPSSVVTIGANAFGYVKNLDTQEVTRVKGFKIRCVKGSAAETYAIENGIAYEIIPEEIKTFKASKTTTNSITLKWNKEKSADGYVIKQYKNGKWVDIKKITKKSTTSYKVTKLTASKSYKFKVVVYQKKGSKLIYSNESRELETATNPKAVTKLKATKTTNNSIILSWARNKNVNGYVIEMKKGKKWVQVKKITKNATVKYTQTKLSKKTTYNFRIKAYKKVGSKTYYSTYKTIKAKTK
ncbi:MAG: leucine-rich repeat protein [Lachnospiraceae bacterium]|nr:leucine-rich repeat protein [Lachnospiraceae bacterium]